MATPEPEPEYTAWERVRIAGLIARGAKRTLAGEGVYLGDIDRRLDRIKADALKRSPKTK